VSTAAKSLGGRLAEFLEEEQRADTEREAIEAIPAGTSDDALALRFAERHVDALRYVPAWAGRPR
jgi:hypothetical protein